MDIKLLYKGIFRDIFNLLIENVDKDFHTPDLIDSLNAITDKYSNHRLARAMAIVIYLELCENPGSNYNIEPTKEEMQ